MARKPAAVVDDAAPMLSLIETPDLPAPTVVDQARVILLDAKRFDQFYDKVKGETDAHVADVSTPAGRAALKSLAFRVTKTHTTLKAASLELTEGWRSQVAAVNAARGPMIERLTALAAEVRKPLTDWEDAEAARVAANAATLAEMRAAAAVSPEDTSATVTTRGREIYARTFEAPQWLPSEADEAETVKDATVAALVAARNRLAKDEADAAELEILRKEKAERDERDRIEAEKREEEARVAREAEEARQREADRVEAERVRVENERLAEERRAEDERQRVARASEQAAQAERDRLQAEHDEAMRVEREAREKVEREAQEERDRIAEERLVAEAERQRIANEQAAQAAEDARLAKNRAHVGAIMRAAKEAIMTTGVSEEHAKAIVVAIKAGLVPAVSISFRKDG